jgi:DNA-binding transcriptional ArsR family regulator
MQDSSLSRARRIRDPRSAAALGDPLRRRILLSFVARERTVAELAAAMGLEIKRLHYHVAALARLGLLRITKSRQRAGRPIKYYRASASAFFVPGDVAAELPSAHLTRQLQEALGAARRGQDDGVLYEVNEKGEPRMRMVALSPARNFASAEIWRMLALSSKDAQSLSAEIRALLEKYAKRSSGGSSWLIHFALCSTIPQRARK